LATMLRCKWLDKNHRGYFLLIEPDTLTLYDIYTTLHGGIPIGESSMQGRYGLNSNYHHSDKWSKIVQIEDEITQYMITKFRNIKIVGMRTNLEGDFVNGKV